MASNQESDIVSMLLSGSAGAGLIAFLGKLFLTNLFGRLEEMVKAVQVMSNDKLTGKPTWAN